MSPKHAHHPESSRPRDERRRSVPPQMLLLGLLLLVFVRSVEAGVKQWTTQGPYAAEGYALAIDPENPSIVYAGSREGVIKTTNRGRSWSDAGAIGEPVYALAIDPWNPSTLYAATWCRVLKTIDAGASWTMTGFNGAGELKALVIDPDHPATLYAATKRIVRPGSPSGPGSVYKSVDGGGSWTEIKGGLYAQNYYALAIDPEDSATLCLGTNNGVFRSIDGGASWSSDSPGISDYFNVYALATDPWNPATLYAGTTEGVFKSFNFGDSWSTVDAPLTLTEPVIALAIDPRDPFTLYAGTWRAGIFKSSDGGHTWTAVRTDAGSRRVNALAIDPQTPSTVYAGSRGAGVLQSTDAGHTWPVLPTGPTTGAVVWALAIDPRRPATLYAGTLRAGIFRSIDAGHTWTAVNAGLAAESVRALAIEPEDPLSGRPATVYAGTSSGVFKSVDGATTWTAANRGIVTFMVVALAIDPSKPSTLYAGTSDHGIFKSTDGGHTWAPSNPGWYIPYVHALVIDPRDPSILYVGATWEGVIKTIDGGATWNRINQGLDDAYVWALVIDPRNSSVLYAGTSEGMFKTLDGGASWSSVNTGIREVFSLMVDPRNPSRLYMADDRRGLFRSVDGGDLWTLVEPELHDAFPNTYPYVLAINPWSPSTLYAGTSDGVFELLQADCDDPSALCLNQERFLVEVVWRDFAGRLGASRAVPFGGDDSGLLWFFDADNWEMLIKVLDGCALNDRFWVFAAATTNVEYGLRVTDTATGVVKSYFNPLGNAAAAITDVGAFATCGGAAAPSESVTSFRFWEVLPSAVSPERTAPRTDASKAGPCTSSATALCLSEERFQVEVEWRDFAGRTGSGRVVPFASDDSGLLWFFDADNWEMLVKVLDGCRLNGRFWVFSAATTNVEYTLRVTDTTTGLVRSYFNPMDRAAAAITDTNAFNSCDG